MVDGSRSALVQVVLLAEHHEHRAPLEAVETSSDRAFGLVFAGVFGFYGLYSVWSGEPRFWSVGLAAVFLGLALTAPRVLSPLNRLWTKLGLLLGRIVNPIILALLFFTTITPIALLMRWTKKDPLRRTIDRSADSYWIPREPPGPPPESMKNQF